MTSAADIAGKAADAILSRVERTHPRALHRDMLIEEITRAIEQVKMTEPRGNLRGAGVIEGRVWGRLADVLAQHGLSRVVLVL